MKNKKIKIVLIYILIIICLIGGCIFYFLNKNYTKINTESTKLNVEYSDEELTGEWKNYDAKITLNNTSILIEGKGITNVENTITITSAGTYYITGNLSDGNILIDANKNDEVQIVLDNATITSSTTAPINCLKSGKLTITLADNSQNSLIDSNSYTDFTDTEDSEPDGTIFSKSDLVINGNGTLNIDANYADGIVSKDGLKIINCNIGINSEDDGIRGKDYVAINNANLNIVSKGDGIKSTNDTDNTLGYIAIEGGNITINCEEDGIQAETVLNISSDANIAIKTNGEISSTKNNKNDMPGFRGEFYTKDTTNTTENSTSSKGIKAGTEITIENGTLNISSTDDSIHSNGTIIINNGNINLSSGDDGIHADTSIVINNGNINISKSYEGIESEYIEINNGDISIVSSDDGINISSKNDNSSMGGKMLENTSNSVKNSNRKLVINDGTIKVNAEGDGLDSNGSIYINGGDIIIAGPNSGGNGALDYDDECVVTGGNLIVYGSIGMWQNPSDNSKQYSLTFQTSGNSSDEIVLKDSNGNEICSFKAEKNYQCITFSNENIQKENTYSLFINGNSVTSLTSNNIVTSNASSNSNGIMNEGNGAQMPMDKGGKKQQFQPQSY